MAADPLFPLSLRNRMLVGGVLFFAVLFGMIGIGLVQTARLFRDQPQHITALAISRHPSEIEEILKKASEDYNVKGEVLHVDRAWCPKAHLFTAGLTPDVFVFDDIPPEAVDAEDLARLATVATENRVGVVFFAGEFFAGNGNHTSWTDSAIGHLLPVKVDKETARLKGDNMRITVIDKDFCPFPGRVAELPPVEEFTVLDVKPEARVVVSAMDTRGETYPLLVWWEVGEARIVVWAGSSNDFYRWKTEHDVRDSGAENDPSLVEEIIVFAAEEEQTD